MPLLSQLYRPGHAARYRECYYVSNRAHVLTSQDMAERFRQSGWPHMNRIVRSRSKPITPELWSLGDGPLPDLDGRDLRRPALEFRL